MTFTAWHLIDSNRWDDPPADVVTEDDERARLAGMLRSLRDTVRLTNGDPGTRDILAHWCRYARRLTHGRNVARREQAERDRAERKGPLGILIGCLMGEQDE